MALRRRIAEIGCTIDPPMPQLLGPSPMSPTRLIALAGALGLAIVAVMGSGLGVASLLAAFG